MNGTSCAVPQGLAWNLNVNATIQELAALVAGDVLGDGSLLIRSARSLAEAGPGDITFLDGDAGTAKLHQSHASAAVVRPNLAVNCKALIQVADPLAAFIAIVKHFQGKAERAPLGIDPRAIVDPSARIGPTPSIHPLAVIGADTIIGARCQIHSGAVIGRNCQLGDDVVLHPHAVLYDDTVLGDRVIIHAHSVVGADGFGYRTQEGRQIKVPQLGSVIIGNDVEIGACATVDRGTFESTTIGDGTKIDNLVQIGHNCKIGPHNLIIAQAGIAGSSSTGANVILTGQAGVKDHVHIGDGAVVCAQAGVAQDIGPGEYVFGTPSRPLALQRRIIATMDKLPEIRQDVRKIKKHLGLED